MNRKTFRVLRMVTVLVSLALSSGCATNDGVNADLLDPTIKVRQVIGRIPPNQMLSAPVDLNIELEITNRSNAEFLLRRLSMQSLGTGNFGVPSQSRTFNERIAPGESRLVQMWVRAYLRSGYVAPVETLTMRGSLIFSTEYGKKTANFLENVNLDMSRR